MKIKIYHPQQKRAGLILSPLFSDAPPFQRIVEELSSYRLIVPTFDGFMPGTTFSSIPREGDLLYKYFRDQSLSSLDFILGFSLGANIALELFERGQLTVGKIILDGALNQKGNAVMQKMASMKFKNYRKNFLKGNIRRENVEKKYPHLYEDLKSLMEIVNDATIKNVLQSICSFSFPKLKEAPGQLLFLYGAQDPNIKGVDKLHKKYTQGDFVRVEHMAHCNYILKDPKDFLSYLD